MSTPLSLALFLKTFNWEAPKKKSDLIAFAKQCSVVTLENEFLPSELLDSVQVESGTQIVPNIPSYQKFENKIAQRNFYRKLNIASPKWAVAPETSHQILTELKANFSYPVVLKASQGGYDGYGVRIVSSPDELEPALLDLRHSKKNPILIEEKVSIKKEFAQAALFDGQGKMILLPLVETVQRNGICELVLSKPTLPENELSFVKAKVLEALHLISKSEITGLFSFEFFYTNQNQVYINEGAPRPHNSQHLSMNACEQSQFDLLISFLASGDLPKVESPLPALPGVMINLLGQSNQSDYALRLPAVPTGIEVFPKLYMKKESRIGRKMGHLNLIDRTGKADLVALGEKILKEYQL